MKKEIDTKEINGRKIAKLHGGRATKVFKSDKDYSRKINHGKLKSRGMIMNKTLKLFNAVFQTSSGLTPEFQTFFNTFKKEFKAELESIGATKIEFSKGHFSVSGFYTVKDQVWYFSISGVRFFRELQLLYRTAKDYKDYTGGNNRYATIETGMSKKMHP